MIIITRADEEQCLHTIVGPICVNGKSCVYKIDFHAVEPGIQIFDGKCVLCNRKYGPGYYSLYFEYPEEVLSPCDVSAHKFGATVAYRKSDYILQRDRRTILQTISPLFYVKSYIEHLYKPSFIRRSCKPFWIRYCNSVKCSRIRVRKNKKQKNHVSLLSNKRILSLVGTRRGMGDISKTTYLNQSNQTCCVNCKKTVHEIVSDPVHNVVVLPNNVVLTICYICNTPTIHGMNFKSFETCDGCKRHFI